MQQPREGGGIESLGTVLAVVGWSLALVATVLWLVAFPDWLRYGGEGAFFAWLASAFAIIGCLALAGLGHLLRAMAQLGRNVRRLGEMVLQLQRQQPR